MILNEPIINVFELFYNDNFEQEWQNAYLRVTDSFEYHVTEGYWLLFETENFYVTVGYDGVQKYKKPYVFSEEKFEWWYNGDEEWTDYRKTIFEGRIIHSVNPQDCYQEIHFDSFSLKHYTYGENDEFFVNEEWLNNDEKIMAVGSHLLKPCECGGKAELLIDEQSDYAVRCSSCHKQTCFKMILKEQVEAWNNGDSPRFVDVQA